MPIVQVYIIEGRSDEVKEDVIAEVTEALVKSLKAPREAIRVIITEMPKQHFGIAGTSAKKLGR